MEHRGRYIPRALGAMGAAAGGSLAIVYVIVTVRQRAEPPSCNGIGFGCEPDAVASMFLWGVLGLVPATALGVGLLLLSMLWPTDPLRRNSAYGIAALYAVAALAVPFLFDGYG